MYVRYKLGLLSKMAVQNNNYLTSILSQIQTISTQSGLDQKGYTNSIFGIGYGVECFAQGDHNQKVSGIQQTLNSLTSLISKLVSNEASQARQEVQKGSKNAQQTVADAEQTKQDMNTQLSQLEEQIQAQNKLIGDKTQELAKKNQELEDKQKEVNEIIAQINAKQAELGKETDPEKQAAILTEISGLSEGLKTHIDAVTKMKADVADISTVIETAYTEIETAKGNQVTIQQQGEQALTQLAEKSISEAADAAETTAKGTKNEFVAAEAEAAAAAASSNAFTAAGAAKLYRTAADQEAAGTTRISGAVNNINTVRQGIGSIASCADLVQKFDTSIGGALNVFNTLIGGWNSAIEPMITSLGSWDALNTQKENLDHAVEEDKKAVDENKPAEHKSYTFSNKPSEYVEGNKQPETIDVANTLKTPTVEIKPFEMK